MVASSVWGPFVWKSLHYIAAQYPLVPTMDDKKNYKIFFETLAFVLPCASCRFHFSKLLRDFPMDEYLDSRETLSEWVWEAHNKVNARIGKSKYPYEMVQQLYSVGSSGKSFLHSKKKAVLPRKKIEQDIIPFVNLVPKQKRKAILLEL